MPRFIRFYRRFVGFSGSTKYAARYHPVHGPGQRGRLCSLVADERRLANPARRIAPDLVGIDLLRHQLTPLFPCHDFWTTPDAYYRAVRLPAVQQLLLARRVLAESAFELGSFSFPSLVESSKSLKSFEPVSTW
jgi:hypothetical protein